MADEATPAAGTQAVPGPSGPAESASPAPSPEAGKPKLVDARTLLAAQLRGENNLAAPSSSTPANPPEASPEPSLADAGEQPAGQEEEAIANEGSDEAPAAPPAEAGEPEDGDEDNPPAGAGQDWQKRKREKLKAQKAELAEKLQAAQAEIARLKTLETDVADLRRKLEDTPAPVAETVAGPLASVQTLAELEKKVAYHQSQLDQWDELEILLLDNPEAAQAQLVAANLAKPEASYQQLEALVKRNKRDYSTALRSAPQVRQRLQNQAESEAFAAAEFKWWNQPDSAEYQLAQKALAKDPTLKQSPYWRTHLSYAIKGYLAHQAEKAAKAKPAAVAKPPPPPPRLMSAPRAMPTLRPNGDISPADRDKPANAKKALLALLKQPTAAKVA